MRRGGSILLTALLAPAAALAGCLLPEDAPAPHAETGAPARRPTVVALIDTGINPYHKVFRAAPGAGAERWAEAFGAEVVNLTQQGDYETRFKADESVWASLEPNKLYAFAGTRVFGISIARNPNDPPVLDSVGHGTGTASMVAREDPGALLVMIQVDPRSCDLEGGQCPVPSLDALAMEWAAEQPWIDIISVSLGYPGNPPQPRAVNENAADYVIASQRAHEGGKTIVTSAGNAPPPPLVAQHAGPPWVIAVGGAQPAQRGEALYAARGADVVANYTEWVALGQSVDGWDWSSGTSYSGPIVAGTLSRALAELRQRGSAETVPPDALRDALNATATYFTPLEWNPTKAATNSSFGIISGHSLPILAPAVQMGWGYVHGGMADEIARRVLENDLAPPPEKAQTAAHMAKWQSLREAYWARAG